MRPVDGVRPISFQKVFNQKAWDDLRKKNATLLDVDPLSERVDIGISERTIEKKAVHQHPLKDTTVAKAPTSSWFSRLCNSKGQNTGYKLFTAYVGCFGHDDSTAKVTVDMNNPQHFRVACAFVAAGACRFNKHFELVSTDQVIDKAMVERIDNRVNYSGAQLAYSYLALNIKMPKGFLEKVFIPHFVTCMVNSTDRSESEVRQLLSEVMASDGVKIVREADITLERVMELKNRLRQMELLPSEVESSLPVTESPDNRPRLPKPASSYRCDRDDAWLITYQVEHHRFLKLPRDFPRRVQLWAQRNKRVIGVGLAEVVIVAVIAGILSGGIGTAIYLCYRVVFEMVNGSIGALITAVRTKYSRHKIQVAMSGGLDGVMDSRDIKDIAALDNPEGHKKHRNIHQLLKGTEYLSRRHQLTKMTRLLLDMKTLDDDLTKLQKSAGDSVQASLKFQRLQVIARQCEAHYDSAVQEYDQMVVAGVQQISALGQNFECLFSSAWKPFQEMSDDQLTSVLNDAANHSSVKGHWYLSKEDSFAWIKSIVPDEPGNISSRTIHQRVDQVIIGREEAQKKKTVLTNDIRRKVVKMTIFGRDLVLNYAFERVRIPRVVAQALGVGLDHLIKRTKPGADMITPNVAPLWIGVFVVLYLASKGLEYVNNKRNRKRSSQVQQRVNDKRWDEPERGDDALSTADWNAMRRQAKHQGAEYVANVKRLISVLDTMEALEASGLPSDHDSPEYREHLVKTAVCMLRYKKLIRVLDEQLYGSIGLMHHVGMQHKSHFDQRLRCIQLAD